jgi:hypothetical protein
MDKEFTMNITLKMPPHPPPCSLPCADWAFTA